MPKSITSYARDFDWPMFTALILLLGIGLSVLYSSSLGSGGLDAVTGEVIGNFSNFKKQLVFSGLGIGFLAVFSFLNYKSFFGISKSAYIFGLVALIAVLIFGRTIRGSRSWFGFGGFGIQPVEIAKVMLLIFFARYFSIFAREPDKWKPIFGSGLAFLGYFGLVLLEPDLGSALILLVLWVVMLAFSGLKKTHVIVMLSLFVVAVIAAWLLVLKPYQKDRIADFVDPSRDPQGRGYNVTQSMIAIGSGGFFGKGLGFGSQSQLRFLPERQTDFIFSVLAEELGFVGVLSVLALFGVIFYRAFLLARKTSDDFTLFLILGISTILATEVIINIGGNLRLLPVTGIALPFISYGGSSLVSKFIMVGILESIALRDRG